jgi:hypothetical protein
MYTAVNLANGDLDHSGFETEKDAISYISGLICDHCSNDLKMGYYFLEKGSDEKVMVDNVLETDCGGEWWIIKDEDYENCESIEDIFIAGGMTPADQSTEDNLTFEQKQKMQEIQDEIDRKIEEKRKNEDEEL